MSLALRVPVQYYARRCDWDLIDSYRARPELANERENKRTNEEVITLVYAFLLCHIDDSTICALQCRYFIGVNSFSGQTFVGAKRLLNFDSCIFHNSEKLFIKII